MAKARKDFSKKAASPAVDELMKLVLNEDDIPAGLLEKAAKEGLPSRFSFYIAGVGEDISDSKTHETRYAAIIYPSELDGTFKCPDVIRAMIPNALGLDGCMETEWHTPKSVNTPVKIAKYLTSRGFKLDKKIQKSVDAKIYSSITAASAKVSAKKKKKAPYTGGGFWCKTPEISRRRWGNGGGQSW